MLIQCRAPHSYFPTLKNPNPSSASGKTQNVLHAAQTFHRQTQPLLMRESYAEEDGSAGVILQECWRLAGQLSWRVCHVTAMYHAWLQDKVLKSKSLLFQCNSCGMSAACPASIIVVMPLCLLNQETSKATSQAERADSIGDLGRPPIERGWPSIGCAYAVVTGRERWKEAGHECCCI